MSWFPCYVLSWAKYFMYLNKTLQKHNTW
jgi:hypothetical protein